LRRSIDNRRRDRPVFAMLPKLVPSESPQLVAAAADFAEEAARAGSARQAGDLRLLAWEARSLAWANEGLRCVGRWQLRIEDDLGARDTWAEVGRRCGADGEARLRLATIHRRLGDLGRSDRLLRELLADPRLDHQDRAEIVSLLAGNAEARWEEDWRTAKPSERRRRALQSRHLAQAREHYRQAFGEFLPEIGAAVDALSLLAITRELARSLPEAWEAGFDGQAEAGRRLRQLDDEFRQVSGGLAQALAAGRSQDEAGGGGQPAASAFAKADLAWLSGAPLARTLDAYRQALPAASAADLAATRRRLKVHVKLEVLAERAGAALAALGAETEPPPASAEHVLLFTGHMIDQPGRVPPRFPGGCEETAARALAAVIAAERRRLAIPIVGIAGGACGGDLLFHDACGRAGIASEVYLALPPERYLATSVEHGGRHWIGAFRAVLADHPVRILAAEEELPAWLRGKPAYSIWQRANLWMLNNALARGGSNVTLIALWNGEAGDGPGGTQDMMDQAGRRGAKAVVIDTTVLFAATGDTDLGKAIREQPGPAVSRPNAEPT
jgi:hypothetical protein